MTERIGCRAEGSLLARLLPALLLAALLPAAGLVPMGGAQSLDRPLANLLAHPQLRDATVGVAVRDLLSGEWLVVHEADTALIPASNMKVVTAVSALEWLGGKHVFYTRLGMRGSVEDGELRGDLILEGNGDPWFGGGGAPEDTPKKWVARLAGLGVRRVTGDLNLVEHILDRVYSHPDWGRYEPASTVAQEVAALGLGENVIKVTCRPGTAVGRPARLFVDQPCGHVQLVNKMVTVSGRSSGPGFGRATDSNRIAVRGRVALKTRGRSGGVAIHDPPLFLARVMRMRLRRAGITLAGEIRREPADDAKPAEGTEGIRVVAEHRTTVVRLLPAALGASDNRVAEILGKAAGAAYTGKTGSFTNAGRAAAAIMQRANAVSAAAAYRDGSGLSRLNRLTARQLVALLGWVVERPYARAFSDSLAYGGERGTTLKRRFTKGAISSSIRAKTGYLDGVRAISGYLRVGDDGALAFALIVNGPTKQIRRAAVRNAMDDFIRSVWSRARARAPRNRPDR